MLCLVSDTLSVSCLLQRGMLLKNIIVEGHSNLTVSTCSSCDLLEAASYRGTKKAIEEMFALSEMPLSLKKSPVLSGTGGVKRSREEVISDDRIVLSVPEEEVPDFAMGGEFRSHTFLDDLWIYRIVMEMDFVKDKVKVLPFFDAISKESGDGTELDFKEMKGSLEKLLQKHLTTVTADSLESDPPVILLFIRNKERRILAKFTYMPYFHTFLPWTCFKTDNDLVKWVSLELNMYAKEIHKHNFSESNAVDIFQQGVVTMIEFGQLNLCDGQLEDYLMVPLILLEWHEKILKVDAYDTGTFSKRYVDFSKVVKALVDSSRCTCPETKKNGPWLMMFVILKSLAYDKQIEGIGISHQELFSRLSRTCTIISAKMNAPDIKGK